MTRFARGGENNRKRPLEATTWSKMKKESDKKARVENKDSSVSNTQTKKTTHKPQIDDFNQSLERTEKTIEKTERLTKCEDFPGSSKYPDRKSLIEEDIRTIYKKEKRRETRRVKRIVTKAEEQICYNCRGTGHQMSDCPKAKSDMEHGTGICFKCGSTEHVSAKCAVKLPPGKYPYAKCFICNEMGHLSKQCPDNPKGLYPMGGCCNICESVEHYQRDCPKLQNKQGGKSVCLPTWNLHQSADAEIEYDDDKPKPPPKKKTGPKVVKF